jgi:hypothetical protein
MRWKGRITGIRVGMSEKGSRSGITLSEGNNFLVMNDPLMKRTSTVNSDTERVGYSVVFTSRVRECDSSL